MDDLMGTIVFTVIFGLLGLLALFWVIRAAVVSGMRKHAVWEAQGGVEAVFGQRRQKRARDEEWLRRMRAKQSD